MRGTRWLPSALLLLLATAGCTAPSPPPINVDVAVRPFLAAPLYLLAARHPGDIRLRTRSMELAEADLATGRAAAAVVPPTGASRRFPAFATVAAFDDTWLVARHPEPNFIWATLRDRFVLSIGGTSGRVLSFVLQSHGLPPDRIILRGLGEGAFRQGSGDYLQSPSPPTLGYPVAAVGIDAGPFLRAVAVGPPGSGSRKVAGLLAEADSLARQEGTAGLMAALTGLHPDRARNLAMAVRFFAKAGLWPEDPRLLPRLINRTRLVLGKDVLPPAALDPGPGDAAYLETR